MPHHHHHRQRHRHLHQRDVLGPRVRAIGFQFRCHRRYRYKYYTKIYKKYLSSRIAITCVALLPFKVQCCQQLQKQIAVSVSRLLLCCVSLFLSFANLFATFRLSAPLNCLCHYSVCLFCFFWLCIFDFAADMVMFILLFFSIFVVLSF